MSVRLRLGLRRAGAVLCVALAVLVALVAGAWEPDRSVASLRARWAPPPSEFVMIDGLGAHLRDVGPRGDPLPVVLLHGTSASLHTWEGWVRAMAPRRRVITFDLPGFGLTGPDPRGEYSIERYVRFVLRALDARGVRRCVLGGNSLGGNIAWETAVSAPERVERLVLVDAGGYAFTPTSVPLGFRIARTPWLAPLARRLLTRRLVASSLRNVYGDTSRVTDALVKRYFELTLREGNRGAVVERFAQVRPGEHEDRIRGLRVPTLIVWGGNDRLIPLENARRFHRDIAGSELAVFAALGHVPQEEAPAETAERVLEFLGRR